MNQGVDFHSLFSPVSPLESGTRLDLYRFYVVMSKIVPIFPLWGPGLPHYKGDPPRLEARSKAPPYKKGAPPLGYRSCVPRWGWGIDLGVGLVDS